MTNNELDIRAGSESYLETVSVELRRLGHEVAFYSPTCGATATRLRGDGFEVYDAVMDLPRGFDVIHGQHVNAVGMARTRLPRVPLVFATHSWLISALEDPVPELGAAAYIAFNEFTRRRLQAHVATTGSEIFRLTQPVETSFADAARIPIAPTPRRAVAVSRRMTLLPARLAKVCAAHGIEFDWVGRPGQDSSDARQEMLGSDIVIAMGRTALEAMAAGRAVLVADEATTGGWITSSSYPGLEADGLTGLGNDSGAEDLEALLGGYAHQLGSTARHLAVRHHAAQHHAVRLVEIYSAVADTAAGARSPHTVALLASDRFALERRAVGAEWLAAGRRRELEDAATELREVTTQLHQVGSERDQARHERALARRALDETRRELDRLGAELDRLASRRAELREQRDQFRKERNRLRGQRRRLRKERDEAHRSVARMERLRLVRLGRGLRRLVGRPARGAD